MSILLRFITLHRSNVNKADFHDEREYEKSLLRFENQKQQLEQKLSTATKSKVALPSLQIPDNEEKIKFLIGFKQLDKLRAFALYYEKNQKIPRDITENGSNEGFELLNDILSRKFESSSFPHLIHVNENNAWYAPLRRLSRPFQDKEISIGSSILLFEELRVLRIPLGTPKSWETLQGDETPWNDPNTLLKEEIRTWSILYFMSKIAMKKNYILQLQG